MARTKRKKASVDAFVDRAEALDAKIDELFSTIKEHAKELAYADLEADLTSDDNEHEVYMTGDGVGIEIVINNWNFTVLKRTWEQIFVGYQGDSASVDAYECLKMAEAGVAKVQTKLKELRKRFDAQMKK